MPKVPKKLRKHSPEWFESKVKAIEARIQSYPKSIRDGFVVASATLPTIPAPGVNPGAGEAPAAFARQCQPSAPAGFVVSQYLWEHSSEDGAAPVTVERLINRDGTTCWAIRSQGNCMARDGTWESEPTPSSRDHAFLMRCRFACAEDAFAVLTSVRAGRPAEKPMRRVTLRVALDDVSGEFLEVDSCRTRSLDDHC